MKLAVRALIGLAWPLLRSPGSLTAVNSAAAAAAAAAALRPISSSHKTGFVLRRWPWDHHPFIVAKADNTPGSIPAGKLPSKARWK